MSAWTEAIDLINNPGSAQAIPARRLRWPPVLKKKLPITVTGMAGSGKTQLFSALTAKETRHFESVVADAGYARTTQRRLAWAVRTIPGAASTNRDSLTDRLFDSGRTRLYGLVHVVSYGYNTVWDGELTLESQLRSKGLAELRSYQRKRELADFEELADLITLKTKRARADQHLWPRWLLIVVNKADLFWSDISQAGEYYLPGSNSAFDYCRRQLAEHFGGIFDFKCETLPVALSAAPFRFTARQMDLTVESQLSSEQMAISVELLRARLEALSGF
jgi:hypothetical protein